MRCPDCNKFVSYDEPQLELGSDDVELEVEEGTLTISGSPEVRLVLPCGECSTELKETTFSFEFQLSHECPKKITQEQADEAEFSFSEPEAIDRLEDKDRHGRKIKYTRYMTHYYGAQLTLSGKCPACGEELSDTQTDEVPASGMDEMV